MTDNRKKILVSIVIIVVSVVTYFLIVEPYNLGEEPEDGISMLVKSLFAITDISLIAWILLKKE